MPYLAILCNFKRAESKLDSFTHVTSSGKMKPFSINDTRNLNDPTNNGDFHLAEISGN